MKLLLITAIAVLFETLGYCGGSNNTASLYSYSGYVGTPSAYISDGQLGLYYSYLPNNVAPFLKGKSENWLFTGTLGFLPFMECYFSVYVAPQVNLNKYQSNYGAHKTRSLGVKFKILEEKQLVPAVSIGIYDPLIKESGENFSSHTVSSLFIVSSKKLSNDLISLSLGYGNDKFSGEFGRLNGVFGGLGFSLNRNINLLVDYDTEFWAAGINAKWRGVDMLLSSLQGHGLAYRIGYNFTLLD